MSSGSGWRSKHRYSWAWRGLAIDTTSAPTCAWYSTGEDVLERDVEGVRALVVAPAHVQADPTRVDPRQRAVDGADHQLDPRQEVGERPVGEEGVALEGEVGGVDLEQQPALDDGVVLRAQRLGDGVHVLLHRGVVPVLHGRRHDAGGRRGHERLGEGSAGDERALGVDLGGVAVRDRRHRRRGGHEVHLPAQVAGHDEVQEVRMVEQVPHERPLARRLRTRSSGAGRR